MQSNPNQNGRVYFKGLHALRYFAAVLVLISHVEMIKQGLKVNHIYDNGSFLAFALESLGPMGVTFFFVLSGFLITYLLLKEKEKTATVNIKSFYIRRALRIWPIYFIFTLLAFLVFPKMELFHHYYFSQPQILYDGFYNKLAMYFLFVPGFVLAFYESIPWAGHLWSIGVEEQFYLGWPWFAKKVKNIQLKHFVIAILIIVSLKGLILFLHLNGLIHPAIKNIVAQSKFECMLIGGLGAWLVYKNRINKYLKIIVDNRVLGLAIVLCFALTWFLPSQIDDIKHILLSPLFLILILGVSFGEDRKWLENAFFTWLGNLSYGFYLFHMVCVVMVIRLMPDAINYWCAKHPAGDVVINILYYGGSLVITTLISGVSYKFIEKPFLKFKTKFAIVKSGKI